jgi:hypothetical protein
MVYHDGWSTIHPFIYQFWRYFFLRFLFLFALGLRRNALPCF